MRLLDKLSGPGRADPDALNAILWHALKPGIPEPAPVRSARLARMVFPEDTDLSQLVGQ